MTCHRCGSNRVLSVTATCSDACICEINGNAQDGYVPKDVLIGEEGFGDAVQFSLCLDCGQMQGTFPQGKMALEGGEEREI